MKDRQEMSSPQGMNLRSCINSLPHAVNKLQADFLALIHVPDEVAITDFKFVHKPASMKKSCFRQRIGEWFQRHLSLSLSLNAGTRKAREYAFVAVEMHPLEVDGHFLPHLG